MYVNKKKSVSENRINHEQAKRPRHTHTHGFEPNSGASVSNNSLTVINSNMDILALSPIVLNQRTEALLNFIQNDLPNIQSEYPINDTNSLFNTAANTNYKTNNDNKNSAVSNKETKKNGDDNESSQSPRCPICFENLQEVKN